MTAKIFSATLEAFDAKIIEVEVDVSPGLPGMYIVGLPGASIKESRERVRGCLRNSERFKYPIGRISINLAPADSYKYGTQFDLAIAVGILIASNQFACAPADCVFLGELSLKGEIRAARGIAAMVIAAKQRGLKRVFIPAVNFAEALLIKDIECLPVRNIEDVVGILSGKPPGLPVITNEVELDYAHEVDCADIIGHKFAKRALEISAAGGHNIRLCGPPGAGKSMLARALVSLLPEPSHDELLEQVKIYSVAGLLENFKVPARPFREPHHTIPAHAFLGGGTIPRPGEISLAHNGVLFMDEFPEFQRQLIESLRQPLERGTIKISRLQGSYDFPARFILAAAQNPCPCGYFGDPVRQCVCMPSQIQRYKNKISGPIIDRIDLHLDIERTEVGLLDSGSLSQGSSLENSAEIRLRVAAAQAVQYKRYGSRVLNASVSLRALRAACAVTADAKVFLQEAEQKYSFSTRSYFKILRISRTIADLENSKTVEESHIAEALRYRFPERNM